MNENEILREEVPAPAENSAQTAASETATLPVSEVTAAEETAPATPVADETSEEAASAAEEPAPLTEEEIRDGEKAKVGKIASRVGIFVTVTYLIWMVLTALTVAIGMGIAEGIASAVGGKADAAEPYVTLFANVAALFSAAMIARAILPKAEAVPRSKFGVGHFFCALGATVVCVMITAPLGQGFTHMWNLLTGSKSGWPLDADFWPMLIFAGILTPIVEELIFRRFLIGRLRPLGEGMAIVISAAIFAVFHMNFTQIFFTFFCGLVWGYVYCRSGKFHYAVLLHMAYNSVYGILLPYMTEWSLEAMDQIKSVGGTLMPEDILPFIGNLLILLAYGSLILVIVALAVLGVITLSRTLPRLKVEKGELSLTRQEKLRAVFTASGFIAMLLVGAIYLVSNVMSTPVLSLLLQR